MPSFGDHRQAADELFDRSRKLCGDEKTDYETWRAEVEVLVAKTRALKEAIRPLVQAEDFDQDALEPDQVFVLFAIQDSEDLLRRAEYAIDQHEVSRAWRRSIQQQSKPGGVAPCPYARRPHSEDSSHDPQAERSWVQKWLVAEAYGALSSGTSYAKVAQGIDQQRGIGTSSSNNNNNSSSSSSINNSGSSGSSSNVDNNNNNNSSSSSSINNNNNSGSSSSSSSSSNIDDNNTSSSTVPAMNIRDWEVTQPYSFATESRLQLSTLEMVNAQPTAASQIIQRQSEINMQRLRAYYQRAPMSGEERAFVKRMQELQFSLFHATDAGAHLIHRNRLLSLGSLRRMWARQSAAPVKKPSKEDKGKAPLVGPKVKSTDRNLNLKGDVDFTFFRLDVATTTAPSLRTRFGSTTFMADAECLYNIGWVSLHDQVYPFKEVKTRKVQHQNASVRVLRENGDQEMTDWMLLYGDDLPEPGCGAKVLEGVAHLGVKTRFTEEIFYGPDVMEGVLMTLVRELRRVAGLHLDHDVGTVHPGPEGVLPTFVQGAAYRSGALAATTPVALRAVLSAFFRIEAKIPVVLRFEIVDTDDFFDPERTRLPHQLLQPVPAVIFHELGDGRYYIDEQADAVQTHHVGFVAARTFDLWQDESRARGNSAEAAKLGPVATYWNELWYLALHGVSWVKAIKVVYERQNGQPPWKDYGIQGLKDPRKLACSAAEFTDEERAEIRVVVANKLKQLGASDQDITLLDQRAAELL